MKLTNLQQMQIDCITANEIIKEIQDALRCTMSDNILDEMLEAGGYILCQFLINKVNGRPMGEDPGNETLSKGLTSAHFDILKIKHNLPKERINILFEQTKQLHLLWLKYDLITVEGKYIADEHFIVDTVLKENK